MTPRLQPGALGGSGERNWVWFGLIVSLGLHLALCAYFYRARFQSVEAVLTANQQTPMFKVKNVDLSQVDKSSADLTNAAAKPEPDNATAQQPDEKKAFDKLLQEVQASTAMPDDMQNVLPDKPKVDPDIASVLPDIERSTAQTLSNSPNATHDNPLERHRRVGPPAAGAERDRTGHEHFNQAAKHFHEQDAGRQRRPRKRPRRIQRSRSIARAKRSARIRDKTSIAR